MHEGLTALVALTVVIWAGLLCVVGLIAWAKEYRAHKKASPKR